MVSYAVHENGSVVTQFTNLIVMPPVLFGFLAGVIVLIAAGLSIRFARKRLSYEAWHAVHVCLYAAVLLALLHQLGEGSTFKANALTQAYWWLLWAVAIVAFVAGRIVLPIVRNARHEFRVAAVVPESDNVTSVYVAGKNLDRLPARAGQFFIWRFPGHGGWWRANPFSLSAAPDGQHLRLTAKAVGSTSASLRNVPVGTRVFAEGPYGAFTALQRTKDSTLLIAGGVGITPIRALLEELSGPITVLYRVRMPADAVLLAELQQIAARKGAVVHVLQGRTTENNQPFDPRNLQAMVPDIHQRDVYVCGPYAMTSAVLRSLRTLKVPSRQVHAEMFALGS
jgi:predicted ferric reductase